MSDSSFNGLLVLDKPAGMTSRDAVDRAQGWFPRGTRLGHTGTLDPLATGVLVLCVGKATRLADYVQRMDKIYRAGIHLGARSTTDDADGEISIVEGCVPPTPGAVTDALHCFVGEIDQVPPAFSAAKLGGRRAYALARRGQDVNLTPRRVRIYEINVVRYDFPALDIEVRCGKGTYIRALARDLGERLGCGAMIAALRRSRVGPFRVEDAIPLDCDVENARRRLLPMETALAGLARVILTREQETRWRQGQAIPTTVPEQGAGEAAVFTAAGALAGIGVIKNHCVQPERVIAAEV